VITVHIPLRTGRGLNNREHHFKRYSRERKEKFAIGIFLNRHQRPRPPVTFILTRVSPGQPMDDDNVSGALKAVRDAVAEWIGVDDGDARVQYAYAREQGEWGVRIEWREA
jgi:hypothetical protein